MEVSVVMTHGCECRDDTFMEVSVGMTHGGECRDDTWR